MNNFLFSGIFNLLEEVHAIENNWCFVKLFSKHLDNFTTVELKRETVGSKNLILVKNFCCRGNIFSLIYSKFPKLSKISINVWNFLKITKLNSGLFIISCYKLPIK